MLRRLLVIGEAAARLTPDTEALFENIPMRKMAGMRNRVVYDYGQIDFNIIWETVTFHLPEVQSLLVVCFSTNENAPG